MNTVETSATNRRPSLSLVLQIVLGIWLLVSPFFVGYATDAALWNTVIAGVAVLLFGFMRAGMPHVPSLWFMNLLPGAWLLLAPFLFGYLNTGAFWNSVVVGIIVLLVGIRTRGAVPGGDLG